MSGELPFRPRSPSGSPLSTGKAQYYPHQQQPTVQRTTDQLNREELARLQSGNGYRPYYCSPGLGSSWGWGWGYPPCSPFPLFWLFCVAGAVVGTAAIIVTAPVRALSGAPPYYYARRIIRGHVEPARLAAPT